MMEPARRFLGRPGGSPLLAAGILCTVGIACTAIFGRGPVVTHTAAPPAPVHHTVTTVITSNPHLHIAPTPAPSHVTIVSSNLPKPGTHTIHVVPPVQIVHQTWTPQWDAQHYIAVHRGLATIHGVTHDAMGKPVANVRLALQHPGGKPFANAALKHITFTAANGSFTMTNVRPGTYRIYASVKPAAKLRKAYLRTTVHAESSENVSIKI